METNNPIVEPKSPASVKEVLQLAKEKISKEANWTQRAFARNERDVETFYNDARACRWCALGAVFAVAGTNSAVSYDTLLALQSASNKLTNCSVSLFNDDFETSHGDVLALLDITIEEETKKGL